MAACFVAALSFAAIFPPRVALAATASAQHFVVDTAGDPGPSGTLSLRQAVALANADAAADTITFAPGLNASTIVIDGSINGGFGIAINNPVNIVGPGATKLTLSGNDTSRIFSVHAAGTTVVSGLTLTHGYNAIVGGAIGHDEGELVLADSVVSDSSSGLAGGGILVQTAKFTLLRSRVSGNHSMQGGGIRFLASASGSEILQSTISNNVAELRGGGISIMSGSAVLIEQSLISGNEVSAPSGPEDTGQGGGGIDIEQCSYLACRVSLENSTVAGNFAYSGGGGIGITGVGDDTLITSYFSTIARNSAEGYDTGVGISADSGDIRLNSSIIADNGNRAGGDDLAGAFMSTCSVIENPQSATLTYVSINGCITRQHEPAQLASLADNGGPTLSMLPAITSPAIDGGLRIDGTVRLENLGSLDFDQRGQLRLFNGAPDAGAVERGNEIIFRDGFGFGEN